MDKNKRRIKKILKVINKIDLKNEDSSENSGRGRKHQYTDDDLFKIFIVMKLNNIDTIKGIWRYLMNNKKIKKLCGIEDDIDRSTLNRRLGDKIKGWF